MEKLAECVANGEPPDRPLRRWLEGLPPRLQKRLATVGLLEGRRLAASKPLAEHLEDWRQALLDKGACERHAQQVFSRAERTFRACRFTKWSDLSASAVMRYLGQRREGAKPISAQTFNFYLQAVKQFAKWMVRDGRATESPLAHLQGLNVRTDRRHDRRALTADELRRLFETTPEQDERGGMSGHERAMLYRLAVETGLRQNELRSLTRASFDLEGDPPTVTVEAAYSKHRRDDTLPLRPEVAVVLRDFLRERAPATRAFHVPNRDVMLRAYKHDLRAAGIAYKTDAGYADFHALRHTFITLLAQSGVHPKTAQSLARHSTITLTMDRYSHSVVGDHASALDRLPDFDRPKAGAARATGTDDRPVLSQNLSRSGGRGRTGADSGGPANGEYGEKSSKTPIKQISTASLENRRALRGTGGSNPPLSARIRQKSGTPPVRQRVGGLLRGALRVYFRHARLLRPGGRRVRPPVPRSRP